MRSQQSYGEAVIGFGDTKRRKVVQTDVDCVAGRNDELYCIWVYVICFGALAHRMASDASKGQEVCCDGFLAHRKWKNRDGSKGHRLNLIARNITLY